MLELDRTKPTVNISVVITCYSEGDLLLEAMQSVLAQTVSPAEIVVVNDASPDAETNAVCRQLETNPLVHVIWRSINGGPSAAREDGFRAARGEILVPLDADDLLPDWALEKIWAAFQAHPDAGFIYGHYLRQDKPGQGKVVDPGDVALARMLSSRAFSPSSRWTLIGTAPLRRSLWEQVGGCDPAFGSADLHDLEFWIRAIALPCRYYALPGVIYIWRRYLGTNSRRVTPLSWYRIAKKHFAVYCQVGLEYRANELLLLGSKWLNQPDEIRQYSQALLGNIRQGQFKLPTLLALLVPTPLFHALATFAGKHR